MSDGRFDSIRLLDQGYFEDLEFGRRDSELARACRVASNWGENIMLILIFIPGRPSICLGTNETKLNAANRHSVVDVVLHWITERIHAAHCAVREPV